MNHINHRPSYFLNSRKSHVQKNKLLSFSHSIQNPFSYCLEAVVFSCKYMSPYFATILTFAFKIWTGAVDIAGSSAVHVVGGISGLVATIFLKPRTGRFKKDSNKNDFQMASPTNVLLGTFMLWWGWLGFNCGSTFGISGEKWKLAAR